MQNGEWAAICVIHACAGRWLHLRYEKRAEAMNHAQEPADRRSGGCRSPWRGPHARQTIRSPTPTTAADEDENSFRRSTDDQQQTHTLANSDRTASKGATKTTSPECRPSEQRRHVAAQIGHSASSHGPVSMASHPDEETPQSHEIDLNQAAGFEEEGLTGSSWRPPIDIRL